MAALFSLFKFVLRLLYNTVYSDIHSPNWGFLHGISLKFLKAWINLSTELPIELVQRITSGSKYLPWPGLKMKRLNIPDQFREQAHQWCKKYFEDKYGHYPSPKIHHWSLCDPLEAQWIIPTGRESVKDKPIIYYVHGGGYMFEHACLYNHAYRDLIEASSSNLFCIDYRLGPKFTLSSMLEDVLAGYLYIISDIDQGGINLDSSRIFISGESAGGGLVLNFLHSIRYSNIPSPSGSLLISPAADLTLSQPSLLTNNKLDYIWTMTEPVTLTSKGLNIQSSLYYWIYNHGSEEIIERFRKDGSPFGPKDAILWPEISPIFDPNMDDLPPTMIIVGDWDSFRDFGIVYGKRRAEAEIKLAKKTTIPNIQTYVFEHMTHAFPLLPPNKYCKKALKTAGEFIYQVLNADDQKTLNSKVYKYIPDFNQAYKESKYNMYWNNTKNQYSPWNSPYPISDFPTTENLTAPGVEFVPFYVAKNRKNPDIKEISDIPLKKVISSLEINYC